MQQKSVPPDGVILVTGDALADPRIARRAFLARSLAFAFATLQPVPQVKRVFLNPALFFPAFVARGKNSPQAPLDTAAEDTPQVPVWKDPRTCYFKLGLRTGDPYTYDHDAETLKLFVGYGITASEVLQAVRRKADAPSLDDMPPLIVGRQSVVASGASAPKQETLSEFAFYFTNIATVKKRLPAILYTDAHGQFLQVKITMPRDKARELIRSAPAGQNPVSVTLGVQIRSYQDSGAGYVLTSDSSRAGHRQTRRYFYWIKAEFVYIGVTQTATNEPVAEWGFQK